MTNEQIIQYIKENYKLYNDTYFWSSFVLPTGEFVAPENDDYDDYGEHANIIAGVAENCFNDNWYKAEEWLELNCVKCNVSYPYINFPSKPTKYQYYTAEDWINDMFDNRSVCSFDIIDADYDGDTNNMEYPLYVSLYEKGGRVFDIEVYNGRDITDIVKKASASGVLEENKIEEKLNSSIREFTRDSRVRDKNGNLILCSLVHNERLDKYEYGIYFVPGRDYYLNITNPIFLPDVKDITTELRKLKYDNEIDRFKLMYRIHYDYQVNEIKLIQYLGFDGVITFDKKIFIVCTPSQVISKDIKEKEITLMDIKGDGSSFNDNVEFLQENNNKDNDDDIKVDDNIILKPHEEYSSGEISYDILVNGKEAGILTILPKEQYLKQISVYKTGLGIGTKVLTYLIENDIIDSLDVDRQNEGALHLYERLGFKPYQLIWGSVDGNGNDRYVMIHSNHELVNCYVYYQGDSYSSTYADDKMMLLGKTLDSGDNYYVLPITDKVWKELEDINIYREDVSEMLYHMKHGRIY